MSGKKGYIIFASVIFGAVNINFYLPPDCSKIKTGKFYYFSKTARSKIFVERSDSVQVETNSQNGDIMRSKIIWKNACSYNMYINSLSTQKLKGFDSLISTIPTSIDIIKVEKQFYIYSAKIEIAKKIIELKDTIYLLKQL